MVHLYSAKIIKKRYHEVKENKKTMQKMDKYLISERHMGDGSYSS